MSIVSSLTCIFLQSDNHHFVIDVYKQIWTRLKDKDRSEEKKKEKKNLRFEKSFSLFHQSSSRVSTISSSAFDFNDH